MASEAEERFYEAWLLHGIRNGCQLLREHKVLLSRKWKVDFALIPITEGIAPIAIEIEGRGRHQSWSGFAADAEKYNALTALGWKVFRVPAHIVTKDPEGIVNELCELICGVVPEESVIR